MEIIKADGVCFECRNVFQGGYEIILNRKVLNKIKLCSCCASKLYLGLANCFVPKSPKNIINSKHKIRNKK